MSKQAEEYLKEKCSLPKGILEKRKIRSEIVLLMQGYHESRVNAVTDEMIDANTERLIRDGAQDNYILGRIRGVKWLKNKLLNK